MKLKSITIIHSSTTETVRLPPEGEAGLTVHPPAVRTKLPLHRKVREKKLHTKVGHKRKSKKKDPKEQLHKPSEPIKKENGEAIAAIKETKKPNPTPIKHTRDDNTEVPKVNKIKSREYRREISQESKKSQKSVESRSKYSDRQKIPKEQKAPIGEPSGKHSVNLSQNSSKNTSLEDFEKPDVKIDLSPLIPTTSGPIYENIPNIKGETSNEGKSASGKIISSRLKRSNRVSTEIATETAKKLKEDLSDNNKEPKSPVKVTSKKNIGRKSSPSKRKKKKEVIEYKNDDKQLNATKSSGIPHEDPLGKVQNWLMHSISVGKTSENFGIMTLTLPKSKSSPVSLSGNAKGDDPVPVKPINPPKIVHKNDKVVQIPKLSQKRSRSAGNLRKSENKKDEKVKLQVVYKPPFKFSVKLRNNRILGAVGSKIVDDKNNTSHLARKSLGDMNERKLRTAMLIRTCSNRNSKSHSSKSKNSPHITNTPSKEICENPFTFPSGVAPMSVPSTNPVQLPIYLTDQVDIDSNVHTVPSDLDVLLSESEFLFSDA